MRIPVSRALPLPERLRRRATPTVVAGDLQERFATGRSKLIAGQTERRKSTIRAWRAAETESTRAARQGEGDWAEVTGHPFAPENGTGSRQSAAERAARTRAIEQAFREQLRDQAEAEVEERRPAGTSAKY